MSQLPTREIVIREGNGYLHWILISSLYLSLSPKDLQRLRDEGFSRKSAHRRRGRCTDCCCCHLTCQIFKEQERPLPRGLVRRLLQLRPGKRSILMSHYQLFRPPQSLGLRLSRRRLQPRESPSPKGQLPFQQPQLLGHRPDKCICGSARHFPMRKTILWTKINSFDNSKTAAGQGAEDGRRGV